MLKLYIYDYMHNFRKNLVTIFQLLIVFGLIILLSSTVFAQAGVYLAFRHSIGEGDGLVLNYPIRTDMVADLQEVKEIVYANSTELTYPLPDGKSNTFDLHIYSDAFSKYAQPALINGVWPDSIFASSKYLNCVIVPNRYGIKTGDVISFQDNKGSELSIYISGVMEDEQYLYDGGQSHSSSQGADFTDLLSKYSSAPEYDEMLGIWLYPTVALVTSEEQLEKFHVEFDTYRIANGLVLFNDDISDAAREHNNEIIQACATEFLPYSNIELPSLESFWKLSDQRIRIALMTYLPIILISVILVLCSILGYEYFQTQKSMLRYSVYFTLGTRWKRLVWLCLFQKLVNSIFSMLLFLGIYRILDSTSLHNRIFFTCTSLQLLILSGVCMVYIIFGTLIPYRILKNSAPDEIIREVRVQ